MPKRPPLMSSIVAAIFAATAGCSVRGTIEAMILIRSVTAATPVIMVTGSRVWFQCSVSPSNPRHLTAEKRKSKPISSASCPTRLLRSKVGMYCGAFREMIQPLLKAGMKTPSSMVLLIESSFRMGPPVSPRALVAARCCLLRITVN